MRNLTTWRRLEPRFRDRELSDSLQAALADPLWLLSRQWQLGEFDGVDAGTPIAADLERTHAPVTRYRLGGPDGDVRRYRTDPADPSPPLETITERERVRSRDDSQRTDDSDRNGESTDDRSIRLAVEAGEQFLRLLDEEDLSYAASDFAEVDLSAYPSVDDLLLPADALDESDHAGPDDDRYAMIVGGRSLDGDALYRVVDRALPASRGGPVDPALPEPSPAPSGSDADAYEAAAFAYREWYDSLYDEPDDGSEAWDESRLDHQVAVATEVDGDRRTFRADDYRGGGLNWYSFEEAPDEDLPLPIDSIFDPDLFDDLDDVFQRLQDALASGDGTLSMLSQPSWPLDPRSDGGTEPGSRVSTTERPTPVQYPGRPAPRWWELEDGRVNLDRIDADSEDLSRLLLLEFTLLYGNDWFDFPLEVPVGSFTEVESLTVTDTFGATTTIEPTWTSELASESNDTDDDTPEDENTSEDDLWNAFAFRLADSGSGLFMPPVEAESLTTDPVATTEFRRDELANVAWAIERSVEGPTGEPLDRHELGQEGVRGPADEVGAAGGDLDLGDEAMTDRYPLPAASNAEVQYRLLSDVPDYWFPMLPEQDGIAGVELTLGRLVGDGEPPTPWGRLLDGDRLSLPEEEISRTGVEVDRHYRYTRWIDGSTHLWAGKAVTPGNGEAKSGLTFDTTRDVPENFESAGSPDTPLSIAVVASAPEDDPMAEYVVLENRTDASLELEGWTVRDAANHQYTFGDVTLSPRERVTLHTGAGSDDEDTVYWDAPTPIWNNAADVISVYDAADELVVERSYPDVSGIPEDSSLSIDTSTVDAARNDYENLNDEYVTFTNDSDEPLDLSRWVVRDIAGHGYRFPEGTEIAPGESLRLRTGDGIDGGGDRYWDAGRPVWNNTDDAVLVYDDEGTLCAGTVY